MNAKWICPAITPFQQDGAIDFESAGRFYDHLIANEIDGVLIGGSLTGFASDICRELTLPKTKSR